MYPKRYYFDLFLFLDVSTVCIDAGIHRSVIMEASLWKQRSQTK